MAEKELFIDDNVVVPEEILKMTSEERKTEIARLETIAREERQRILESRQAKHE